MTVKSDACEIIRDSKFIWHQRFELAPGVFTPGPHDVDRLLRQTGIASRLDGKRVIDVGTANGGVAFGLEARGATVVAVDITTPDHFGFDQLSDVRGSNAEFVQATVYELDFESLGKFDIVIAFGLLYHLLHPLLALQRLKSLLDRDGTLFVESAIADADLPADVKTLSLARFYADDSYHGDASNWFVPTLRCLVDWCDACDLTVDVLSAWPRKAPTRALIKARLQ